MTSFTAEHDGRFMAGYGSNLPSGFRLSYAASKPQWQVWHLFLKLLHGSGRGRRIEITMGITCHTCHAFFVFGLGERFKAIATCHQTCHRLGITINRYTWSPKVPGRLGMLEEAA
jgi:hypothetical protein